MENKKLKRRLSHEVEDCSPEVHIKKIRKKREDCDSSIHPLKQMRRASHVDPCLKKTIQWIVKSQKEYLAEYDSLLEKRSIRKRQRRCKRQRDLSHEVEDCSPEGVRIKQIRKKREDCDPSIHPLKQMHRASHMDPCLKITIQWIVKSQKEYLAEYDSLLEKRSIRKRQRRCKRQRDLSHEVENCSPEGVHIKQIRKKREDCDSSFHPLKQMRRASYVDPCLKKTIQWIVKSQKEYLAEYDRLLEKKSIRKRQRRCKRQRDLSHEVEDCSPEGVHMKQIWKKLEDCDSSFHPLKQMRKASHLDPCFKKTIQLIVKSQKEYLAEYDSLLEKRSIRKRQRRCKRQRDLSHEVEDCSPEGVHIKQIREKREDCDPSIHPLKQMHRASHVDPCLKTMIQERVKSQKKNIAEMESWLEKLSIKKKRWRCKRQRGLSYKVEDPINIEQMWKEEEEHYVSLIRSLKENLAEEERWLEEKSIRKPVNVEDFLGSKRQQCSKLQRGTASRTGARARLRGRHRRRC